ncbi:MAG: ATP-binding protein [Desulfobacterales bacterium]
MTGGKKFKVSRKADEMTIILNSTMENIDKADRETRIFLNENELQSEVFSVCLCLREGLINAVKHGHKNDSSKIVRYYLKRTDRKLIMEIEDKGEGFEWNAVKKGEPVVESDHGRGLAIIRKYFTKYEHNEKGNIIKLVKELDQKDEPN